MLEHPAQQLQQQQLIRRGLTLTITVIDLARPNGCWTISVQLLTLVTKGQIRLAESKQYADVFLFLLCFIDVCFLRQLVLCRDGWGRWDYSGTGSC